MRAGVPDREGEVFDKALLYLRQGAAQARTLRLLQAAAFSSKRSMFCARARDSRDDRAAIRRPL